MCGGLLWEVVVLSVSVDCIFCLKSKSSSKSNVCYFLDLPQTNLY